MLKLTMRYLVVFALTIGCTVILRAQAQSTSSLPNAPGAKGSLILLAKQQGILPSAPAQMPTSTSGATRLTLPQAEQIALANNPRIRVSQLLAKVQHQIVREVRADELPNLTGNMTAVEAKQGSRLSAGFLTSSTLVEHAGMGAQVSEMVTDFGHTRNMVAAAALREKAQQADAEASREDIVLAADEVFFQALEAQATLKVAQETVAARQALVDQVSALTSAKLKSDLDLSFAQVNLSQSKLLVLDAENNVNAAKAALSAVLGYDREMDFQPVESADLPALPADAEPLIVSAIQNRPDLQSLRFDEQAARKFSRAQHEQFFPTIRVLGVAGRTPVGSSQYFNSDWYGAAGVNMSIPIFNGFRYFAQASEATLQAQAAAERTRDLLNQVVRDVRTSWLNANTALQRVTVTNELLKQANTALELSQTRYQLGLSSIVELSQAQLQQTQAAISNANARSQYGAAMSVLRFQTGAQP
ncbi:MAG TPA: TolC family protein [Acidisarcina sp.]|nr:TolC family protein [Acidisarcina sp.]